MGDEAVPYLQSYRLGQPTVDFQGGARGKEPVCQCRRHKRCRFDPWVGKIPWRRKWLPTVVFLPGESHTEEPGGLPSIGSVTYD